MWIEIIQGCKNEVPTMQRRLFSILAPKMMTVCRRYTKNLNSAEDILQESFIKVFRSIKMYDETRGNFEGWVRKIVVNTCIENWRKNQKELTFHAQELNGYENPEHEEVVMAESNLGEEEILKLIEKLSPGYKIVFNLFAIEGYSHLEIAQQLGITESTSRSQLVRARKVLQDAILQQQRILSNETI
jgi:RNA polymerase sigma factor (sigma-70 family)